MIVFDGFSGWILLFFHVHVLLQIIQRRQKKQWKLFGHSWMLTLMIALTCVSSTLIKRKGSRLLLDLISGSCEQAFGDCSSCSKFCLVVSAHSHGGMETQRRTLARASKVPIFCRHPHEWLLT